MPSLEGLSTKLVPDWMLNVGLRGAGPEDGASNACLVACILRAQAAVNDYEAARRSLTESVRSHADASNRGWSALFQFASHLESCNGRCDRSYGYLRSLEKRAIVSPEQLAAVRSRAGLVRNLRNPIEHTYEWIEKREVEEGLPVVVQPNADGTGFFDGNGTKRQEQKRVANGVRRSG